MHYIEPASLQMRAVDSVPQQMVSSPGLLMVLSQPGRSPPGQSVFTDHSCKEDRDT
jgi:hypothetical protein